MNYTANYKIRTWSLGLHNSTTIAKPPVKSKISIVKYLHFTHHLLIPHSNPKKGKEEGKTHEYGFFFFLIRT